MAKGGATVEISLEKYEEMQDRIAQLETAIEIKSKQLNYALDLVIEREDEISRLRAKQPHWISVNDRLPRYEMMVIVYSELRGIGLAFIDNRDEKWCGDCDDEDVLYWMPLPEPPEEKNND